MNNTKNAPIIAIILALSAGLFFTLTDSTVKYIAELGYPVSFMLWVRYSLHVVILLMVVPFISSYKTVFISRHLTLQIIRALFLLGTSLFNILALSNLSLTLNNSIFYMTPIIVTILSSLLLKEPIGWRRITAIITGFIGIIIVIRPNGDDVSIGIIWAFIAVLCFAAYQLLSRKIGRDEPNLTSILYLGIVISLVTAPFAYINYVPIENMHVMGLFVLYAICAACAHSCLIIALSKAAAPIISSMSYFTIIYMAIADYLIWSRYLDVTAFIGIIIIIASGLVIIWRRHYTSS